MRGFSRSLAELGHSKLGFASPIRLTLALVIVVVSVALAVSLHAPYWYLAILLAVPLSLRLSRNEAPTRLVALLDSQRGLFTDGNHFCGVLGGWLVHSDRTLPHIVFAESLLAASTSSDSKPSAYDGHAPIGFRFWHLSDVQGIEYESDKPSLCLNVKSGTEIIDLSHTKQRDRLVDEFAASPNWQKESQFSWRFEPNGLSILFFAVPVIAFGICTIATAAGFLKSGDLPLVEWGDVKNAKGKGRGFVFAAAALSSAFLFLQNNLPALACAAVGTVIVGAGLVLVYYSCVIKFQRISWRRGDS